jgi:hypothetical protein
MQPLPLPDGCDTPRFDVCRRAPVRLMAWIVIGDSDMDQVHRDA